ncbi:MAG: type II toxin-antitoxin system HicA family toxin [Synergistaceae bacterium]|nr:type II toxin-antitoxin system HicA family toxin [Synergistaceae bacterium]MBR1418267.1 type II toxin-antitoxin system HicA family toxin [Synergistaceae bacterium]
MPELRGFSGQQAVNILIKMGFIVSRKAKGFHVILKRGESVCVVPMHKELAVGTLRSVLRQAKISPEEFLKNS